MSNVLHRDERHHVHGAHARVLALVGAHVDHRDRRPHGFKNGGLERFGFPHHRDDAAVVVLIPLAVEKLDPLPAPERPDDFFDLLQVAPLAEVGDAFDDPGHTGHKDLLGKPQH